MCFRDRDNFLPGLLGLGSCWLSPSRADVAAHGTEACHAGGEGLSVVVFILEVSNSNRLKRHRDLLVHIIGKVQEGGVGQWLGM